MDLIGSHLPLKAPAYFLDTARRALLYGESAMMFYTGAPQNSAREPLSKLKIQEGFALLKANRFSPKGLVVHAPYIINLANPLNPDNLSHAKAFLEEELRRTEAFGAQLLVLHPGSSVSLSAQDGILSLADSLNEVLRNDGTHVTICLENLAGKGGEIGRTFEQLSAIISLIENKDRIGVCLDTCHLNDAGYEVGDLDGLLGEFDSEVGLNRLRVIHLNDSKNEKGSHKDRHENIGLGTIGFKTLEKWANCQALAFIPKILETPYVDDVPPYEKEISMLRSGVYDPRWREKLV